MLINLGRVFLRVFKRFDCAVICSFLWIIVLMMDFYFIPERSVGAFDYIEFKGFMDHLIRVFSLGIPLFITIRLIKEVYRTRVPDLLWYLSGFVFLCLYFFDGLYGHSLYADTILLRQQYFSLVVLMCLSMSFSSFLRSSMRSFWKFNNILFIILAVLYWR